MPSSSFSNELLSWWEDNQRPLPWRETYRPYHVWISEVMLQQTQMERVVPYFNRWIEQYPDVASLAEAHEDDVFRLWEGLGYYNRARNLIKAAQVLVKDHDGTLPMDEKQLLALPGIGPYTAGAILSIADNQPRTAVDANVERVFARVFDRDVPVKTKGEKEFYTAKALELLPEGCARDFNQALMELGALVCKPKQPRCHRCPVSETCEAHRLNIPEERPVPGKTTDYIPLEVCTAVIVHNGLVYVQKRPEKGVWGGLWEYPGGSIEQGETPEEAVRREMQEEMEFEVEVLERIEIIRHGYTRFRVRLHCFFCVLNSAHDNRDGIPVLNAAQEYRWLPLEELVNPAFCAGHRKLTDKMLAEKRLRELVDRTLEAAAGENA